MFSEEKDIKKAELFVIFLGFMYIICVLLLFILSMYLSNKSTVNLLDNLKIENNELQAKYNELENLCYEQEEQIEILQLELEQTILENENIIEEELSYIEPLKELDGKEYLIQYKKIVENHSSAFDKLETLENTYTEKEIQIMCRCIETETYGAPFNAKVNVASVILNRIKSSSFPSSPIEVVTAPSQFAYGRTKISENTKLALEYAFTIGDTTDGAIAFRSDSSQEKWGKWHKIFTDEVGHSFYK